MPNLFQQIFSFKERQDELSQFLHKLKKNLKNETPELIGWYWIWCSLFLEIIVTKIIIDSDEDASINIF